MNMKKYLFLFLISSFVLASCLGRPVVNETQPEIEIVSCTETRLDAAYVFYDKSRSFLESFYKTRRESELYYAWYSSEDSMYMVASVKGCRDKKNKHYYAAKSLFKKNKAIQKLILGNMRTEDQAEVAEIFLESYRKIFPRDIR